MSITVSSASNTTSNPTEKWNGGLAVWAPISSQKLSSMDKEDLAYWFLQSLNLPSAAIHGFANRICTDSKRDVLKILPTEVCIEILSNLDVSDVIAVSEVSKSWRQVALNQIVWREQFAKQPHWQFKVNLLSNSIQLDWYRVFRIRYLLQSNWRRGRCVKKTLSWDVQAHTDAVYTVQCDTTMNVLVSGSRDRTVKVWDMDTRKCTKTWYGHTGSILCSAIDLSRNLVVTGSSDRNVLVWNYQQDTVSAVLTGHTSSVFNVHIWQNYIVTCSKDCTINVWSLKDYQLVRTLTGHTGAVNAIQVVDGMVVSASGDKTIKLWDLETGICLRTFIGHTHGVLCVAFDGKTIVSGSSDRTIRTFDAESGCWLSTVYDAHEDLVRTINLQGDLLITGSYDTKIKVWRKRGGPVPKHQRATSRSALTKVSPSRLNTPPTLKRVSFKLEDSPAVSYQNKSLPLSVQVSWDAMYELRSKDWNPGLGRIYNVCSSNRHLIASSERSSIACWDFGEGLMHMDALSKYF